MFKYIRFLFEILRLLKVSLRDKERKKERRGETESERERACMCMDERKRECIRDRAYYVLVLDDFERRLTHSQVSRTLSASNGAVA